MPASDVSELDVLQAARAALWTDEEWRSVDVYQRAPTPTGTADWSFRQRWYQLADGRVQSRGVCVSRTGEVTGSIDTDEPIAPSPWEPRR